MEVDYNLVLQGWIRNQIHHPLTEKILQCLIALKCIIQFIIIPHTPPLQHDHECNSFFVYGTLRDDLYRNRKNRGGTKKSAWSVGASYTNLAIIYGYQMYGSDSFPYAVKTNNPKHLIIGRLIQFKNIKKFSKKLLISDEIEGFNDPRKNINNTDNIDNIDNIYNRKEIECYVFEDLNDKKLELIGYYESNKKINIKHVRKDSNITMINKQDSSRSGVIISDVVKLFAKRKLVRAYIYYIEKNKLKKMKNSDKKTPNCDWLKRFEHHNYQTIK